MRPKAKDKLVLATYLVLIVLLAAPAGAQESSESFQMIRTGPGLSLHKEMFMLPVTFYARSKALVKGVIGETKRTPQWSNQGVRVVAHAGFEPAVSALRGRRPSPLDEWAKCRAPQRPALYTASHGLTRLFQQICGVAADLPPIILFHHAYVLVNLVDLLLAQHLE